MRNFILYEKRNTIYNRKKYIYLHKLLVLRNLLQTVINRPTHYKKLLYFSKWHRVNLRKTYYKGLKVCKIVRSIEFKRDEKNIPKKMLFRAFVTILVKYIEDKNNLIAIIAKKKVILIIFIYFKFILNYLFLADITEIYYRSRILY
jgi:hypothetical protein